MPEAWIPLPMVALDAGAAPQASPRPVPAVPAVGEEVRAYCPSPRCSADRTHTIISMYEDEIRRVQCVMCGEVHAFRPPRGVEPVAVARPSWDDAMARFSDEDRRNAPAYTIRATYSLNSLLTHPTFGVGTVVEVLTDGKVDVLFQSGSRVLVHGR